MLSIKFQKKKGKEETRKGNKTALERIIAKRLPEKTEAIDALSELKYFNFPKMAKNFAAQKLKEVKKDVNDGALVLAGDDKEPPLTYSIADTLKKDYTIYAVNEMSRIFVQLPKGGHFMKMDEKACSLFLRQVFHSTSYEAKLSAPVRKSVFEWLLGSAEIQISPDFFDQQERYINVKNGVVDLVTGRLKKHDANRYGFLGRLPFKYKPNFAKKGKLPKLFREMLFRTFPDPDDQKRFLQCLAYLISGDCSKKVAFFWVGNPHTGKSTFQRLIAQIVGKENISNIPLAKFSDRFSLAAMFGKKLNMAGETGTASLKALENFKSAAGNDWLDAEYKGQDHFSFLATAKNLFCGNSIPVLDSNCAEQAVFDRFEFLMFQNPVPSKHQVPFFEQKLLEEEGDEILTVIIEELRQFYREGRQFVESASSAALKKKFIKGNALTDSVRAFIDDCCEIAADKNVSSRQLCDVYFRYCNTNGFTPLAKNSFIRELIAKGPFKPKKFHPTRTMEYRGLKGIALKGEKQ